MQTINFAGLLNLLRLEPEERKRHLLVEEGKPLKEGDVIARAEEGSLDNIRPAALRIYPQITPGREAQVKAPYDCVVREIDLEKGTITIDRLL